MHATLEYIGVTLLVAALIIAAQWCAASLLRDVAHARQEQLYTAAERVMDKVLLTPGDPPDWGSNFEDYNGTLRDFGLALYGTRVPYELDPDKVIRLANHTQLPNPLYLNSSYLAELLALEEYGFVLEMVPLLDHSIEVLDHYEVPGRGEDLPSRLSVELANHFDFRIPGANVTGIYALVEVEEGAHGDAANITAVFVERNQTDTLGRCTLDFSEELEDFFEEVPPGRAKAYLGVVIIHTNWHGFVAVDACGTAPEEAPATGYVIGEYIVIEKDVELIPRAAVIVRDEVIQAIPEYESLLVVAAVELEGPGSPAWRVINSGAFRYRVYRVEYIERLSSHVILIAKWRGRYITIIIDRVPRVEVRSAEAVGAANVVRLVRVARLFNYPYVVKLVIWRGAEG
ncbi:MAG: hypothetical protein DRJ56_06490 [Thermoprotei archaeon]|nr:MAG: hypothetical protein DRJ56_06490 [Thermoprotei archaeon]